MLEADIIDPGVKRCPAFDLILYQKCAALGHDLALDHTRHDRITGKMSLAEEFVFLDAVLRMADSIPVNINTIDNSF